MAAKNPAQRDVKQTLEYMEHMSFDPTFEVLTRLILTQNPVSGALEREQKIQGNSSTVLTWNADGSLKTVGKTIGATTYTKSFTWTDGALTGISAWV